MENETRVIFFDRLPDGGRPDIVIDKSKPSKMRKSVRRETNQQKPIMVIDRLRGPNE